MVAEAKKHFKRKKFTWQHDGAGSHAAESTQDWLAKNVPDFIQLKGKMKNTKYEEQWPPGGCDLSPVDIFANAELKKRAKRKAHGSIDSLMRELKAEWDAIPQDQLRKTIDSVPERMDKCIEAKGGRFE